MPLLQMNVDGCNAVINQLKVSREELNSQLNQSLQLIQGMVGSTWIANGASLFETDYETWHNQIVQLVAMADDFQNRLYTEIQQWEETARTY